MWRARLDEHLGTYTVEPVTGAHRVDVRRAHALFGGDASGGLARLLPERDPHDSVYDDLEAILDQLDDAQSIAPQVARFEMQMLAELGFGLDLASCAATGVTDELDLCVAEIRPRGVARGRGGMGRTNCCGCRHFFTTAKSRRAPDDVADALRADRVFPEPSGAGAARPALPDARAHFIAAVSRSCPASRKAPVPRLFPSKQPTS